MADPLSVAASIVGIYAPTIRAITFVVDELNNISDAPETIQSLKTRLKSLQQALKSLQAVSDEQWHSLGEPVKIQAKSALERCAVICAELQVDISKWTKHSKGESKLVFRDRIMVGLLKKRKVKSMLAELTHCQDDLTTAASTATLHASLQRQDLAQVNDNSMALVPRSQGAMLGHDSLRDAGYVPGHRAASIPAKPGGLETAEPVTENVFGDRNIGMQLGKNEGYIPTSYDDNDDEDTDQGEYSTKEPEPYEQLEPEPPRHEQQPEPTFDVPKKAPENQTSAAHNTNYFGHDNEGMQIGENTGTIGTTQQAPAPTPSQQPPGRSTNRFGNHNQGMQIGSNRGTVAFKFPRKRR